MDDCGLGFERHLTLCTVKDIPVLSVCDCRRSSSWNLGANEKKVCSPYDPLFEFESLTFLLFPR